MDAEKALDRIEPTFLFQTLTAMNFGVKFIQYINTLFKAPKAQILTDGVLLDAFSISKGGPTGLLCLPVIILTCHQAFCPFHPS